MHTKLQSDAKKKESTKTNYQVELSCAQLIPGTE